MKPHLKTVCMIVGGAVLSMAVNWASRVYIYDKTYEFPDGLFVGAIISSVVIFSDRRRKKRLRAETREKQ